jgi:hypothetical protein
MTAALPDLPPSPRVVHPDHVIEAEPGYWRLFYTGPGVVDRLPVVAWLIEDVAPEECREGEWVACAILPFEAHLASHPHSRHQALKSPNGQVFDENGAMFVDEVEWVLDVERWLAAKSEGRQAESGDQETREETP